MQDKRASRIEELLSGNDAGRPACASIASAATHVDITPGKAIAA
jgi:hypothetical protein